jgi:uncharacterized membrane protein YfcA
MEIILFILLVGVWAAFVLPSVMNSRRETPMDETNDAGGEVTSTTRPAAPTPAAVAAQAAVTMPRSTGMSALQRERVLARRRTALVLLMIAAVGTLVAAVVTGSLAWLGITLFVDVALAVYIAVLLQIKQHQAMSRFRSSPLAEKPQDEVRMASY